jgi:catechol 2,3-dioxygenase-like lactoylglutathione lyase family enzyme
MLRMGHIEIYSRDVPRAKVFYRDVLGFEVTVEGGELVWLQLDSTEILLRPGLPPEPARRYEDAPNGIVLYTPDLQTASAQLTGRGLVFKGTVDSEKCLTFTDPDGNWFQLVNPEDH